MNVLWLMCGRHMRGVELRDALGTTPLAELAGSDIYELCMEVTEWRAVASRLQYTQAQMDALQSRTDLPMLRFFLACAHANVTSLDFARALIAAGMSGVCGRYLPCVYRELCAVP